MKGKTHLLPLLGPPLAQHSVLLSALSAPGAHLLQLRAQPKDAEQGQVEQKCGVRQAGQFQAHQ